MLPTRSLKVGCIFLVKLCSLNAPNHLPRTRSNFCVCALRCAPWVERWKHRPPIAAAPSQRDPQRVQTPRLQSSHGHTHLSKHSNAHTGTQQHQRRSAPDHASGSGTGMAPASKAPKRTRPHIWRLHHRNTRTLPPKRADTPFLSLSP